MSLVLLMPCAKLQFQKMNEYRYIFDKSSKKFLCPECNKKRFVRYIDTETNKYLPDSYGICDREQNCGYYLDPYKDGYAKMIWQEEQGNSIDWKPKRRRQVKKAKPEPVFIPEAVLIQTLEGYEKNVFIVNLLSKVPYPFEKQDIDKVISLYYLGTIQDGYRSGAISFPFIDIDKRIRTIQVKQFDDQNHTTGKADFLHSMIEKQHNRSRKPLPEWLEAYLKNDIMVSCLFGEHLLTMYPDNPIALVEAPKTAIYGTLYFGFPDTPTNFLWLAVYNLSSFNFEKCKALKGRKVAVFPDLNAFDEWSSKATEIQKRLEGSKFKTSEFLENYASEQDKEQGKDIADYLIKQDWRSYRNEETNEELLLVNQSDENTILEPSKDAEPTTQLQNWNRELEELETYFNSSDFENKPIQLNPFTKISNVSIFIESHLAIVRANNGNKTYKPYLERLEALRMIP